MNIKISGITSMKQLQQLDGLNIDYAGLVFFKPSPRFAGDKFSKSEIKTADLDIKTVGIFVNADFDQIMKMVDQYDLDMVQLDGDETPDLCGDISAEVEVIKTFRIDDEQTKSIDVMIKDYDDVCDYYQFDRAPKKGVGNEGKKFDWQKVRDSKIEKPFFLSGGIGPDDVGLIKKYNHPDFFGIDLNNHFEKQPGVQDMPSILQFMHSLKLNLG
jgi:phosphoribosylanthranilate isomerase